jgi:hypothetical protein
LGVLEEVPMLSAEQNARIQGELKDSLMVVAKTLQQGNPNDMVVILELVESLAKSWLRVVEESKGGVA